MPAAYAAPWPVALGCTVAVSGIVLALIPLHRGERWAVWALLAMMIIPFVTRLATDRAVGLCSTPTSTAAIPSCWRCCSASSGWPWLGAKLLAVN